MKRTGYFLAACGLVLLGGGCASWHLKKRPSILPEYIHKIAVRPFSNHTQQFGLEDKLTSAVQSEFNRDGRYQISTPDVSDGVLSGDITTYRLEPLSYDVNHIPTQYMLTIITTVSFDDRIQNNKLWTDPTMVGELRYFVTTSGLAGSLTEDEARQVIYDQLSRDIATRTFEGFGSSNDSSDKSDSRYGSESNKPKPMDNNPPPPPDPNPPAPSPTQLPY